MQEDLTRRQKQVLKLVLTSINERGYPPTVREIAKALGVRSPNAIHGHLKVLERKGYLQRAPGKSRGLRPTHTQGRFVMVPLVHADDPGGLEDPESSGDQVNLDLVLVGPTPPKFLLRVCETTRRCPGIEPGDFVLVAKDEHPIEGEIVVCRRPEGISIEHHVDDEATSRDRGALLGVVRGVFRKM